MRYHQILDQSEFVPILSWPFDERRVIEYALDCINYVFCQTVNQIVEQIGLM